MYGYLLEELKNDFIIKGIEIGEDAVRYCKSKGLDVSDLSIENFLSTNKEKFDVIILSHVFEHLLSPDDILNKLKNAINTGGKIILSVPNSDSFCRKLFGKHWGWWQVPVHINHFRLSAFNSLAEKNNLTIEEIRIKGGDSLMLLLNFINLFGFRSNGREPGKFQTVIIGLVTTLFRYWYELGNEELTVVLTLKNN
jgi:SAM-dependent methyltransferase